MQEDFDKWFYEVEGHSTRAERFLDDTIWYLVDKNKHNFLMKNWLQEAFNQGVIAEQKRIAEEGN